MSNVLSAEKREQVVALGRLGWSLRRIEQTTGVRRETASASAGRRGLEVEPTTIWRWVQHYGPELGERLRCHLKSTHRSYRVDETDVRVNGGWCRACDRLPRPSPPSRLCGPPNSRPLRLLSR